MRYSLRLILVPTDEVGTTNVTPAGDVELLQMDMEEAHMQLSLERLATAAQSGLRALMEVSQ